MRRMISMVSFIFIVPLWAHGQTQRINQPSQAATSPPYDHPVVMTRPYQRTWYDALLRQFNPDNLDWGRWLEQRRKAFLNETATNPYFKYSLVTTTLLILLTIAFAKSEIDKSRIKWLAQDRHDDLLAHDSYSRQVAHDAIRRYNGHMEKCNRVVEAELSGRSIGRPIPSPSEEALPLQQVVAENAQLKREREQLRGEVEINKAMVNDLTIRINAITGGGGGSRQTSCTEGGVVKQFNELREKLYRERERNKQLKGM